MLKQLLMLIVVVDVDVLVDVDCLVLKHLLMLILSVDVYFSKAEDLTRSGPRPGEYDSQFHVCFILDLLCFLHNGLKDIIYVF